MHLGPIFRSLLHNKTRFVLITLEVALTLAICVNCVALIGDLRDTIEAPSGYAEEELVVVTVRPFEADYFNDDELAKVTRIEDRRVISELDGVDGVIGITSIPLSGGGSSTGRRALGAEVNHGMPYFVVSEDAIETLGIELASGRSFNDEDFDRDWDNMPVILSQELADVYYPDGDALGKMITDGSEETQNQIVGIASHLSSAWPTSDWGRFAALIPGDPDSGDFYRMMVRAETDRRDALVAGIEEALIAHDPGRIVEVETLADIRDDTFYSTMERKNTLVGVILLLVLVTAVGIVGLTAFSITQRTREIGTRRALGASREAVLRHFLFENWLVTTIGLAIGIGLAYGLNWALFTLSNDAARLQPIMLIVGVIALWLTGLGAALGPALRGTRVPPVVATRAT
ncbi:MAG: FtsX-like permease family protein [Acidobacteriota bacterium]